jgi:uncharacterized RDD family membrane protein YckC
MEEKLTIHTTDAMQLSLPIAGMGGRCFAFIIDWHIRLLMALAWFFGALIFITGNTSTDILDQALIENSSQVFYVAALPAFLIYFFYHPALEVLMHGCTPGKRMVGVRIVSSVGLTPSVGALLTRNIFRIIDSLPVWYIVGLATALFHPRQLRIGDIAAGTVLIYEQKLSAKTLEQFVHNVTGKLTPQQHELRHALLARWNSLDKHVRRQLATQFLEGVGDSLPARTDARSLDQRLHQRLSELT